VIARLGTWALIAAMAALLTWLGIGVATAEPAVSRTATAEPMALAVGAVPTQEAPAAPTQSGATATAEGADTAAGIASQVSTDWADAVAAKTGIPRRAILGYSGAALALAAEQPSCHLGWTTLAALGSIESGHGSHGGSAIASDGETRPGIFGPALDGSSYAAVADTDDGALDGESGGDRAVGPLQFIPSTWHSWGADGNGDGVDDPQQIDDAALAAARYLCDYGDLSSATSWRAAVFAYNHVDTYVDSVAELANEYAAQAG
jgi:membrane-bound lytic murein transglycosylase B